jgi:hypothetical protein
MLDISLTMSKSEYKGGEPVLATVEVANAGRDSVIVNRRMLVNFKEQEGELYFVIVDNHGRHYMFQRLLVPRRLSGKDFVALNPNEKVRETIDLADSFDTRNEGRYTVQAHYRNNNDSTTPWNSAWKGDVASSEVTFEVRR